MSVAENLFDFLAEARTAPTLGALDGQFSWLIRSWGFERWTAIPIAAGGDAPVRPFEMVLGRPSRSWSVRYREQNYFQHDAVVRTLLRSNDPVWWTAFPRTARLSPKERLLFDEAREHGIAEGLSAPIRLADRSVWACALTGSDARPRTDIADAARIAAERYILRALELRAPRAHRPKAPGVTERELEIIRLVGRGLNLKQAAHVLERSPSTVYNQIAAAKERLGVRTVSELVRWITETGRL